MSTLLNTSRTRLRLALLEHLGLRFLLALVLLQWMMPYLTRRTIQLLQSLLKLLVNLASQM
ncbi:hypothetical protein CDO37_09195 [Pseudomonas aeruginosa]|nr:hypothetical protein CDO37_09195 [Pseudomonas aeruginosa]PYB98280.1 hypothetical protein DMX12_16875 [Pseudomonas sp. MB-090624]